MEIKEFLHLYLRSGIRYFVFPDESVTNGFLERYKRDYPHGEYAPVMNSYEDYQRVLQDGYKPILRPLSDMTEEEAREFLLFNEGPVKKIVKITNGGIFFTVPEHRETFSGYFGAINPNQTLFLLKKGFDLFGLIEAGLAIDITTLKH